MIRKLIAPLVFALAFSIGAPTLGVHAQDNCEHGKDPKCDIPEAPSPLVLPIAGVAAFAGYVWYLRRRDGSLLAEREE